MNRDDYFRLYNKITAQYAERFQSELTKIKARLQNEQQRDLEGLNRIWSLANGTPPPEIEGNGLENEGIQPTGSYGEDIELRSRNDKIRRAVRLLEGDIVTQPLVMQKLKETFPEAVKGLDPTLISKVLRWLEDHKALETVSMGSPKKPRVYRKKEAINRY